MITNKIWLCEVYDAFMCFKRIEDAVISDSGCSCSPEAADTGIMDSRFQVCVIFESLQKNNESIRVYLS